MAKILCALASILFLCSGSYAATTGGNCPTGTNYVNVANEGQSGTFQVTLASLGVTSCYYVGASGSDSNAGTTEAAPFLHIPGTPKFTGKASIGAGVGVIVQGGYVAHFGNSSVATSTGGMLNITTGGSSGSPVYYGVDPTWFTGSSFARPMLSGDNPLSTSFVSACTYDNSSPPQWVNIASSASYVILDGFESSGLCWASGEPNIIYSTTSSKYVYVERWYHHGWTTVSTSTDSAYFWWDRGSGTADNDIIALNVVDGNDSSAAVTGSSSCHWNSTNPCFSGGAMYEGAYIVWGNVLQHVSNVAVTTNNYKWHDNFVNNLSNSYQNNGQHTNCNNEVSNVSGNNNYFYNNVTTNVFATECYYLATSSGSTLYGFNNVFWGDMNYLADSAPSNCVFFNNTSSGTQTAYWTNNTVDYSGGNGGGCKVQFAPNNSPLLAFDGTGYFANTDAIGYSTFSSLYQINSGATATVDNEGGEVYETESAANAQGYTTTDNYAPTSASGATHAAGTNLSSYCASVPDPFASAACAMGTTGGVTETSSWGGKVATYPAVTPNPRGTAWDAGAYQFTAAPGSPQDLTGTITPRQ